MGCLWMMTRTARCAWLRARLSLQPGWMLTSWGGNTAGFTDGLTGLSPLYKGLMLWKCSIQYVTIVRNPLEVSLGPYRKNRMYLFSQCGPRSWSVCYISTCEAEAEESKV